MQKYMRSSIQESIESSTQIDNATLGERLGHIAKVALPIVIANFLMTIGSFISALMLSQVSEEVFAAGAVIASIQLVLVTVTFIMFTALSAVVSQIVGENKALHRVGNILCSGASLGLLLSIPIIIICLFVGPILSFLGQDPAVVAINEQFFGIFFWSIPATALMIISQQFLLGIFRGNVVLFVSIFSLISLVFVSYVLIFGKFSFPVMGVEGLAWANVIVTWGSLTGILVHIYLGKSYREFKPLALGINEVFSSMKRILNIGSPISFQMGNELLSFFVTTVMVGWIGVQALEAKQVAARYMLLSIIPLFGLSQAATVLVGRYYGERLPLMIKSYGWTLITIGVIYSSIILLLFSFLPEHLIGVFGYDPVNNKKIFDTTAMVLIIVAIGQIFDSIRNVVTGALKGLQDTKFPMLVSFLVIWPIGIPLAYVMGFPLEFGLVGIIIAHDISMAISSVVLIFRWRFVIRKLVNSEKDMIPLDGLKNATA